jgi:hypothetical protein
MMSLAAIQQLSRDLAIRACRENKIPFVFELLRPGKRGRYLAPDPVEIPRIAKAARRTR